MNTDQNNDSDPKRTDVPHITANELSKYVWSGENDKRKIIVRQKKQNTGATTHYSVSLPIIQLGLSCGFEGARFEGTLHELTTRWAPTPRGVNKQLDNIAAVNHCRECLSQLPGYECELLPTPLSQSAAIMIAGVRVSVRPEIIIREHVGSLAGNYGAIKLYFSKKTPLSDQEKAVGAALLYRYLITKYGGTAVTREHCIVLDVFAQTIGHTPENYAELMSRIESACDDIARRWTVAAAA